MSSIFFFIFLPLFFPLKTPGAVWSTVPGVFISEETLHIQNTTQLSGIFIVKYFFFTFFHIMLK